MPTHEQKVMARHASMVLDPLRTDPLKKAIDKIVKKNDVVCDIGTGLGLLSLFALCSGAGTVYAVDCDSESIKTAVANAKRHGIIGRISFIEGHSFDVYLPEKVDVVICETIGSAAFDENILATLADAKKRLLKRTGKIIPDTIELWCAPATFQKTKEMSMTIETALVPSGGLLSEPKRIVQIKTRQKFSTRIHVKQNLTVKKEGELSGMAIWPRVEWAKGLVTDCSPYKPATHWKQCILPSEERAVKAGDKIRFELIIQPDKANPKEQTEILWKTKVAT